MSASPENSSKHSQTVLEVKTPGASPEDSSNDSGIIIEAKASGANSHTSVQFVSPEKIPVSTYDQLISAIREVRHASESRIESAVEQEKVREAWETGKLIDEHILLHKERQDYGDQVMNRLSNDLGISRSEISRMVAFARTYPIGAPAHKLSWAHYREMLSLDEAKERETITKEASEKNWTRDQVREEVKKRNSPSPSKATSSSNEKALASPEEKIKLPESKPGKVGMYRVVETAVGPNKGKLALDLGFDSFYEIRDMGDLRAGDIVQVKEGKNRFYHFTKVLPKSAEGKILLNAPKNPVFADEADLFTYQAYVSSVYDGDTFHALIDLGFGVSTEQRVRLRQLDAPELLTGEGKEAKAALEKALMRDGGKIILKVSKSDDQYGRFLVDVFLPSSLREDRSNLVPIAQELLDSGVFEVRGDSIA